MRRSPYLTVAALAVGMLTGGCAGTSGATWTFAPGDGASAAPASSPAPSTGSAGAVLDTIAIEAFDLGFKPNAIEVDTPGRYEITFTNSGAIPHDVTFPEGAASGLVDGGGSATFEVDIPAEGTSFICSVPGHAQAGMEATVTVKGAAAADGQGEGEPAPATQVLADPNASEPVTYDAAAPPLRSGDVQDIELVVTEEEMTVAPGFVQRVWTFNGTVPGPVIRVKVGDTIRIRLKNPTTNELPHSIDFHASQVAWNDEMTSINPGEEKLYEFTADYAGVWMYHCGTAPVLHHIASGMYGMVIVEPAEGLPPVDNEFALVQSEWYLGPQGEVVDLDKAGAAAPAPDFVVFNGVANQYLDAPLKVGTGESVRIFVLDAGPSIDSSFHVVGTIFDTVIKEGIALRKGNAGSWGAQAMDLSPSQGGIVEFTTAEDGLYPIVTHAFNFVGRGALGLIQAGDGDPLD